MRVLVFLIILSACTLPAQIYGLATNSDGTVLYFSTSLRQKDTLQAHHPKIYRWTESAGLELFAERSRDFLPRAGTTPYRLLDPAVSAAGSVISFHAASDCFPTAPGPIHCDVNPPQSLGAVATPSGAPLLERNGVPRSSPNGRYVAFTRNTGLSADFTLVDLETGTESPGPPGAAAQQVLDDGRVFLWSLWTQRSELWQSSGESTPLSLPPSSVIHPAGTAAVYAEGSRLFLKDLATGRDAFLSEAALPLQARFTTGGEALFFNGPAPHQLSLANPSQTFAFPHGPIVSFTVSGDGRIAYVSFPDARVLRLDTAAGATTEILPPSPNIASVDGALAPGTLLRIRGGGFPDTPPPEAPYPAEHNGISVDFGITRGRVVSVTPNEIAAQVSWSIAPAAPCLAFPDPFLFQLRVWTPNDGPWDAPELWLRNCTPVVPASPAATHENGDEVTAQNPARPNEVIRLYATGLGPVATPQEDGVPAPASPPVLAVTLYPCGDIQVTPVSLVPGQLGLYTASVRIPATVNQEVFLACFAGYVRVRP